MKEIYIDDVAVPLNYTNPITNLIGSSKTIDGDKVEMTLEIPRVTTDLTVLNSDHNSSNDTGKPFSRTYTVRFVAQTERTMSTMNEILRVYREQL